MRAYAPPISRFASHALTNLYRHHAMGKRMEVDTKVLNLLPKEAAERLRVSVGTLANWRTSGEGPRYIKWGRKVLYPVPEIEAFEASHLRSSTAGD